MFTNFQTMHDISISEAKRIFLVLNLKSIERFLSRFSLVKFQRYKIVWVLAGVFGEAKTKIELDTHMIYQKNAFDRKWKRGRKAKGHGRVQHGSISVKKKRREVSLGTILNCSAVG